MRFANAHRRDRGALWLFALSDIASHVITAGVRLCVRRRLVFRSSLALEIPCFCRPAIKSAFELQTNVVPNVILVTRSMRANIPPRRFADISTLIQGDLSVVPST